MSYYYEKITIWELSSWFTTWESCTTHLTSPRNLYTNSSHQDLSIVKNFVTPMDHPKRASTTDSLSLLYCNTSHRHVVLSPSMPHLDLQQKFPKLIPNESHPNSVHRITSRKCKLMQEHCKQPTKQAQKRRTTGNAQVQILNTFWIWMIEH
jgi:hypothetical protein